MTPPHTLYGAEISYYTGKVRSYLKWKGIPHTEITATAEVYRDVILPRVGFPVIPVVITPEGATLQDSSDILDTLERRFPNPSIAPAGGVQRFIAALFELYGDEWLVIPAMHYRWHHNRDWAVHEFGALIAPNASPQEQFTIGNKRAAPFAHAAVALGAEPHMHAAIEKSYETLLADLDRHFASHPYLLGTQPCIGDFSLFGPLYAHQYRDPTSGSLMQRLAPRVVAWVERMRDAPSPGTGSFLADDLVPETLLPVIQRIMREQVPELSATATALQTWLAENPGQRIPRGIGEHEFEIEGVRGRRLIGVYKLWMLQRALDVYRSLSGAELQRANALIERVQGRALRGFQHLPRLCRAGMSVALS